MRKQRDLPTSDATQGKAPPKPNISPALAPALAIALVVAIAVLVTAVHPAGFSVDPLGTGQELGGADSPPSENVPPAPAAAAQTASLPPGAPPLTPGAITLSLNTYKRDSVVFTLDPLEWFEYKYRIEKGETMVYSWKAPVMVGVEMHSEPDGAPRGYAETFEKSEKDQGHGSYTAPFSGIHGWYWENLTEQAITITLNSAGFYRSAVEFRYRQRKSHELSDVIVFRAFEEQ